MANKSNDPASPEAKSTEPATLATGGVWPVEQLHIKKKTPATVQAGIMAQATWYPGKLVSEVEYDAAKAAFLGGAKHA